MNGNNLILVSGATGYVGGCLVPQLIESGYLVRVLVRDARRLQDRSWSNQIEIYNQTLDSMPIENRSQVNVNSSNKK